MSFIYYGESQDIYGGAGLEPTPINREEYGIPIKTYQTCASQVIDSRYTRLETLLKARSPALSWRSLVDWGLGVGMGFGGDYFPPVQTCRL
ncbi:hypothetical protein [Cylindrospermopsis raciborskii]|uniref:hypothetical protein n=1 Tax=Cylindrospermopsis raciborskii TaxID=77022 RepID=UPI000778AAC8|nr:hypothetical protein [Cylindrospermopsis raciborskii]